MNRITRITTDALLVAALAGAACEQLAAQSYTIRTIAGAPTLRDASAANTVPLRNPFSVVADSTGNLYFSDRSDDRVRRISRAGVITTVAGSGRRGFTGDGGIATAARLSGPQGLAVDRSGNLYIADYLNNRIRKVDAATGIISTVAGNGKLKFSGDGVRAVDAAMDPYDIALDSTGTVMYVADSLNDRIRKINLTTGLITAFAGLGIPGDGGDNTVATAAALFGPTGVAVDPKGNVVFCDNIRIRSVNIASGIITTIAGTGFPAFGLDGPALASPLPFPAAATYDAAGNLYIATDFDVRVVSATSGNITKIAGTNSLNFNGDGPATQTRFGGLNGIAVLADGSVIVTDSGNRRVRKIQNGAVTTIGGFGVNDGPSALAAYLNFPEQVVADGNGGYIFADRLDHSLRRVTAAGVITTAAGTGVSTTENTSLSFPEGAAIGPLGEFYVADTNKSRVVRVNSNGSLVVVAGGNGPGFAGDNGAAISSKLSSPSSLTFDAAGNLYVADMGNFRIRKIDFQAGVITTVAGSGNLQYFGDNQAATASGCSCFGVASDAAGNLFIADTLNNRIRRVSATSGIITTIAGIGSAGYSGDGGPAISAQLNFPTSVAVDGGGNLFVADYFNNVIRRISSTGTITTIAGSGKLFFDVEAGAARQVAIDGKWVAIDRDGILIGDTLFDRIRRLTPQTAKLLSLAAGDGQSGAAGKKLTIAVKVTDSDGLIVSNFPISFSVSSGTATLSAATATTNGDGLASVDVTLGVTAGTVAVAASGSGLTNVSFKLTISPPPVAGNVPKILAGGVAGAGLGNPKVLALVPLGIATAFGANFAAAGTFRKVTGDDLVNGQVPTQFAGVCVLAGGTRAPLVSVTESQVSFQVPVLTQGSKVEVRVIAQCGSPTEQISDAEMVTVQAAGPEFFPVVATADGHNAIAATDAITGAYIGTPNLIPGGSFTPAQPNQNVALYATGFGETTTGLKPGAIPQGLNPVNQPVVLSIGGKDVPAGNIAYVGVAPFSPGLYQVNVRLPADTPDGDLPVVITIGGVSSSPFAYLTVKAAPASPLRDPEKDGADRKHAARRIVR